MNSEDLAAIEKLQKRFERREFGSYSPYIKAVTDNADELISRARRAEELERTHKPLMQGESRYTVRVFDGETPVWDINLSGPELDSERRVAELLESAGRQFMDTPEDS